MFSTPGLCSPEYAYPQNTRKRANGIFLYLLVRWTISSKLRAQKSLHYPVHIFALARWGGTGSPLATHILSIALQPNSADDLSFSDYPLCLITYAVGSRGWGRGVGFPRPFVWCKSGFFRAISQKPMQLGSPNLATIEMFHGELRKPIYFRSEGKTSRSRVTKTLLAYVGLYTLVGVG